MSEAGNKKAKTILVEDFASLTGTVIDINDRLNASSAVVVRFEDGIEIGGSTSVTGNSRSIAIGPNTSALATASIALQSAATASGDYSVAIGQNASASGDRTVSIGRNTNDASGQDDVLIGQTATKTVSGSGSLVLGSSATTAGNSSVSIGASLSVPANRTVGIGSSLSLQESSPDSVVIGDNVTLGTNAAGSVAIGRLATVSNSADHSISMPLTTTAGVPGAIAIGYSAESTASGAIGIGYHAITDGINSIMIGRRPVSTGIQGVDNLIAVGQFAFESITSSAGENIGIGWKAADSLTSAARGIFVGRQAGYATTTASDVICIGRSEGQYFPRNTILGSGHSVDGSDRVDVFVAGAYGSTGNSESVVVGSRVNSTQPIGISIGHYSYSDGVDTVTIGAGDNPSSAAHVELSAANSVVVGSQAESRESNQVTMGFQAKCGGADSVYLASYAGTSTATNSVEHVAIGYSAMGFTQNAIYGDVAIGAKAMGDGMLTGNSNVTIGNSAGRIITSGSQNVFIGDEAGATSIYATASPVYTGSRNVLVGRRALTIESSTDDAVAMGYAVAGASGVSIGREARGDNLGSHGVNIGHQSSSDGYSVAIGNACSASADSVAIGNAAVIDGTAPNAVLIGPSTAIADDGAVAIGQNISSSGLNSILVGSGTVSATGAIAVAVDSQATANHSTAIGRYSKASGIDSIAIGGGADNTSFSYGAAYARSTYSIAIGHRARCNTSGSQDRSIAIGVNTRVYGSDNIALGESAKAGGNSSIAIGHLAGDVLSTYNYSIEIGYKTRALSNNAIAIGDFATCPTPAQGGANLQIAIGRHARASFRSICIGEQAGGFYSQGGVSGQGNKTSVCIGRRVAGDLTTGYLNTCVAIGPYTFLNMSTGAATDCVAIGREALRGELGGGAFSMSNHICIGRQAGEYLIQGSSNTFIGIRTGGFSTNATTNTGSTLIGAYAYCLNNSFALSVGRGARVSNERATRIGKQGNVSGHSAICIGNSNGISGGSSAYANQSNCISLGTAAKTNGFNCVKIGYGPTGSPYPSTVYTNQRTVAIGYQAYPNAADDSLSMVMNSSGSGVALQTFQTSNPYEFWANSSSALNKSHVSDVQTDFGDIIDALRPVRYQENYDDKDLERCSDFNDFGCIGLIAEEVLQVCDLLVAMDHDDPAGINENIMVVMLIKQIQSLRQRVSALEAIWL